MRVTNTSSIVAGTSYQLHSIPHLFAGGSNLPAHGRTVRLIYYVPRQLVGILKGFWVSMRRRTAGPAANYSGVALYVALPGQSPQDLVIFDMYDNTPGDYKRQFFNFELTLPGDTEIGVETWDYCTGGTTDIISTVALALYYQTR